MKLKLIDILNSKNILDKLSITKFDSGVACYQLAHNLKNIDAELMNFDKIQKELIEKYGEKKEDGSVQIEKSSASMDIYVTQMNEIMQQELDIDILTIDCKNIIGFTPIELVAIDWMLKLE